MLKKMMITLVVLMIFAVVPAFADNAGCKNGKFVGSYTRASLNRDVFGDGTVRHTYFTQITLHSDGTANLFSTAFPDYLINTGTASTYNGSWTCRQDGALVVTFLNANYGPAAATADAPKPDIALANSVRSTYLFSVVDDNTLRRIQFRARVYSANQDPTDPAGGALQSLVTTMADYKRLGASDADLLLP